MASCNDTLFLQAINLHGFLTIQFNNISLDNIQYKYSASGALFPPFFYIAYLNKYSFFTFFFIYNQLKKWPNGGGVIDL